MEKLIDEYAKSPDISFRPINIMNKPLRTHIERTTNSDIPKLVFSLDSKSKIPQFELVLLNEDIGHLDIPVYDS